MTRVVLSEGDGKYRSTRIEVGREADDKIEVLQGLTQDDRIVTSAHFMLIQNRAKRLIYRAFHHRPKPLHKRHGRRARSLM